jgi:hypothetical protein
MRVFGRLMSARWMLTLEVCGDRARHFARWFGWRTTGMATVVMVARLIGFYLLERVVIAMVGGGRCGELTFRRQRRLIKMKRNEHIGSTPTTQPLAWLRHVISILGVLECPCRVVGFACPSLVCFRII